MTFFVHIHWVNEVNCTTPITYPHVLDINDHEENLVAYYQHKAQEYGDPLH